MQWLPHAENRRFLAFVLLLLAAVFSYLLGVHWWFTARHLEIGQELKDLKEEARLFDQTAIREPAINGQLAAITEFENRSPVFLQVKSTGEASAKLSEYVKQSITAHVRGTEKCKPNFNFQDTSNRGYYGGYGGYSAPKSEKEPFERASLPVTLQNCSLEEFAPILYDLENGNPELFKNTPILFVDELQINKQGSYAMPGAKAPPSFLNINFTVSGYMPKKNSTSESGKPNAPKR